MERPQIGLEPRGEDGFLDALVELEQMRMAGADADPKNVRPTFAGKLSEAGNRKKECFPRDCAEIFSSFLNIARNVPEKTESEMHLVRLEPAHAAQLRIQVREGVLGNGRRKSDADKQPFVFTRGAQLHAGGAARRPPNCRAVAGAR